MSGAGIKLDVTVDDAAIRRALARVLVACGDLTPLMDEIGGAMETSVALRFEAEAGPGGVAWPPSMRALAKGGVTLTDSGRLRASITRRVGPTEVEVGTNAVYAAIHQFGGTFERPARVQTIYRHRDGSGTVGNRFVKRTRSNHATDHAVAAHTVTMPARPFLGIDADDTADILRICRDWLTDAAGGQP